MTTLPNVQGIPSLVEYVVLSSRDEYAVFFGEGHPVCGWSLSFLLHPVFLWRFQCVSMDEGVLCIVPPVGEILIPGEGCFIPGFNPPRGC